MQMEICFVFGCSISNRTNKRNGWIEENERSENHEAVPVAHFRSFEFTALNCIDAIIFIFVTSNDQFWNPAEKMRQLRREKMHFHSKPEESISTIWMRCRKQTKRRFTFLFSFSFNSCSSRLHVTVCVCGVRYESITHSKLIVTFFYRFSCRFSLGNYENACENAFLGQKRWSRIKSAMRKL